MMKAVNTISFNWSTRFASHIGVKFASKYCTDWTNTKVPIIQPNDLGANNVFPSILSVFENMSISLGKIYLLDKTPRVIERAIIAKKIIMVP
jgi:hypothetical protein